MGSRDSGVIANITMLYEGLKVLQIQHQNHDVSGRSNLFLDVVLVKIRQIVIQVLYVNLIHRVNLKL